MQVVNGDAFVSMARIELEVAVADEHGWRIQRLDPAEMPTGWHIEGYAGGGHSEWEHPMLVHGGDGPMFPGQEIPGPVFVIPSDAVAFTWIVNWWTDRGRRRSATVTEWVPRGPEPTYPSFTIEPGSRDLEEATLPRFGE